MKVVASNSREILIIFFILALCAYRMFDDGNAANTPNQDVGLNFLGRSLLEVIAPATAKPSSPFILAEERTHRKDPLDNYNYYSGGWNISDKHYWASVGFTAIPFFLIGIIWFVAFGLVLLLICCCFCCRRRTKYSYSRTAYALSLIFLVLFTIAVIIGCVVLYHAQAKAYDSTTSTLNYVVKQANLTVENLRNFSSTLSAAKRIGVNQIFLPTAVQGRIEGTQTKINASADDLSHRTEDNSYKVNDVTKNVRLALIVVSATMLLLAFLGFLLSVLGLQFFVYVLVLVGWILVAGTFILCGVFLLFHNVSTDTCVAMDDWVQNPSSHTALDDILPCMDAETTNTSLYQSKEVASSLVKVVNQVITNVSNGNYPPFAAPLFFNQSGPLVPLLCNPYNADLTDRTCSTGELDFSNASQVWKDYVCNFSSKGICVNQGRLTPDLYNQMTSATTVSFGLYQYSPFLVELADCTFVRDTFAAISKGNCPGIKKYSKRIYIGLAMVATSVMLSLIFWVLYAREGRHRNYDKQFIHR